MKKLLILLSIFLLVSANELCGLHCQAPGLQIIGASRPDASLFTVRELHL